MKTISILFLLSIYIGYSPPCKAQGPVQTQEDFYKHTYLHTQRVQELGLYLYKQYSSEYSDVSEELLQSFLKMHDESKIRLKIEGTEIYKILFNYFGKNEKNLSPEQFFINHNIDLHSDLASELMEIEKIADFVDRAENPISTFEFGRNMIKASALLKGTLVQKALFLEKNYNTITKKNRYNPLPLCRRILKTDF